MSPRKVLFQLHWIFGITVGIVLAIVGATGALLSFEQQIVASLAGDSRQVEANGRTPLAPAELLTRVAANELQKHITSLSIARGPSEMVRVTFAPREQRYADPYTGALLPVASGGAETFFRNVRQLHRWLMLGDLGDRYIGRQIVGAGTLLLIFMALTGLYLRWPRGPAARRLGTWLVPDFRLQGRAFLWNLHSVIGTWVLPVHLVIALTGLQWSYEWYRDGLYSMAGVERPAGGEGGPREPRGAADIPTFARAWGTFAHEAAGFTSVNVNLAAGPDRPLEFRYLDAQPSHERAFNTLAIDREGRVSKSERYQDKRLAAQLVSSIFPLHSGRYFGLVGVIVFLIASLAMPLFAVTGWLMYLRRRAPRARRESLVAATEEAS